MKIFLLLISILYIAIGYADSSEKLTANYFDKIKNNQTKLYAFLLKMPKGGDLHYHLDGGSYAKNLFSYASKSNDCIILPAGKVVSCKLKSSIPFKVIKRNSEKYNKIIQDWSVTDDNNPIKNNLKFYHYFPNTYIARESNRGKILAEIVKRASSENIYYLELMINPDEDQIRSFGLNQKKSIYDFNGFMNDLISNGIQKYITKLTTYINSINHVRNTILHCNTSNKKISACNVTVKYLYQINRDVNPKAFFSALLEGFLMVNQNKNFVGISLVGQENGKFSTKYYRLEMRIINFLHEKYPNVKITLHAGELSRKIPADIPYIKSHVRDAVDIAHPNRIGHGTDIKYEQHYQSTLKEMRDHHIAVEVCLTSNQRLLGISGNESSILTYYHHGIPIVLCTDDEGILRTNLTKQFEIAVNRYHFSYPELKNIVRNSIYYSFLPGKNLWETNNFQSVKKICRNDFYRRKLQTNQCKKYLLINQKAQMEWNLEMQLSQFEKNLKNT